MSVKRYEDIAHAVATAYNAHDLDKLDTFYTSDFKLNGQVIGAEGMRRAHSAFFEAFPDAQGQTENLIADGDQLAKHTVLSGTHQGTYNGIAPTGRRVTVRAILIWRFHEGRIAEEWVVTDQLGLLRQLGALPTPATA
jgi:steroid delta-isomerase-like uncharacterized protein